MLKKTKFQIDGIHCASCKTLIETEVDILPGVKDIKVDAKTGESFVEFEEEKISIKKIFKNIEKLNYRPNLSQNEDKEKISKKKINKKIIIISLAVLAFFVLGYLGIQKFGLFELLSNLNEVKVSYVLLFVIGLLASFHCVGMCGGLVIAYSTSGLKGNEKHKKKSYLPHLHYNLGRLISYTLIGGVLGGFGSFFGINPNFTGFIVILAGAFMILLGLSLLTNFGWLEKFKLKTPAFIAKFLYNNKHSKKPKGPFVIGLLNGFMPCGPLQAMQIYALSTGSILAGAMSMGVYALGTIPLMFGFGQFISMLSMSRIKKIIQISGIIVIMMGLFTLNRGLINFGLGFRGMLAKDSQSQTEYLVTGDVEEYQTIDMELNYGGYSPNVLYIKPGVPVRWVINVKQMSGCTDAIMIESLGIKKDLKYGENIIEFTPPKDVKEIKFSCWMRMVWGKFVVTADSSPNSQAVQREIIDVSEGASCSGDGSCGGTCGAPSCGCQSIIKAN